MTCTKCRQEKDRLWHSVGWQCDECVDKIYQDPEYIKLQEAAYKQEVESGIRG